jgi:quercetin dioxygenase-like cupin family protein
VSGYRPSPRPTFDHATALLAADAMRYTWGDDGSGEVFDWLYVSSSKVHELIFGLPVGGSFRHSDQFRTIFAADEVLHVLTGTMMLTHPLTGESHRVETGEAAFFRRDTWHHAHALGDQPLRVLEFFAPPPSAGASGSYARQQELLTDVRLGNDAELGAVVPGRIDRGNDRIVVIRQPDLRWRLEPGSPSPVPVGVYASTEHITVARSALAPGQRGAWHTHAGDECGYVLRGTLAVGIEGPDARKWLELRPGDGWYIPEGVEHRYLSPDGATEFMYAVAPSYSSAEGSQS